MSDAFQESGVRVLRDSRVNLILVSVFKRALWSRLYILYEANSATDIKASKVPAELPPVIA